jgi:hypothetical protein
MRVICIDNSGLELFITLGKVYTRLSEDRHWKQGFFITNDMGIPMFYFKSRFIPLEEHRQNILNNLGI